MLPLQPPPSCECPLLPLLLGAVLETSLSPEPQGGLKLRSSPGHWAEGPQPSNPPSRMASPSPLLVPVRTSPQESRCAEPPPQGAALLPAGCAHPSGRPQQAPAARPQSGPRAPGPAAGWRSSSATTGGIRSRPWGPWTVACSTCSRAAPAGGSAGVTRREGSRGGDGRWQPHPSGPTCP